MKTDKEYPATHSMSTTWFGIDKDGNVAIIDFNENGPVPNMVGEESPESIIEDVLPTQTNNIKSLEFTDQQALHLIEAMEDADINDPVMFIHVVKINPSMTERLLSLYEKNARDNESRNSEYCLISLSPKYGLYIIVFYDWEEADIKCLYNEGILEKCMQYDLMWDEKWDKTKQKTRFEGDLKNLPFYHYNQPYHSDELIIRTDIPKYPFKARQLDSVTQNIAIRFPFSFDEQDEFQIAEFIPCQCEDTFVETGQGSESLNRAVYPATDGSSLKIDENSYPEVMNDTPRILILDDYRKYQYIHLCKEMPFIKKSTIFPIFRNMRDMWNRIDESVSTEELRKLFKLNIPRFEHLVKVTNPYCIIAMPTAYSMLKEFHPVSDNKVWVGDNQFPLFSLEEAKANLGTIERFCNMPYRGQDLKRVIR